MIKEIIARFSIYITSIIAKFIPKWLKERIKNHFYRENLYSQVIFNEFWNPSYFDALEEIYNFFRLMEQTTIHPIFINRIEKNCVSLLDRTATYTNKELIVLTDSQFARDKYKCIDICDVDSIDNKDDYTFIIAYNKDYLAREAANKLIHYGIKYYVLERPSPVARYFHTDKDAFTTLESESLNNPLLHFCPLDFENIFQAIKATRDLNGDYVEIGVFQGSSARAALNYMNRSLISRKSYFLDTYDGFSYEEATNSEDVVWQGTHKDTSIKFVCNYLSNYSNYVVKKCNIITDDLPVDIKEIVICNIDVDMYEAVKAALYKVRDRIVKGGIIIQEDYGHSPWTLGAQKAVHEFLDENPRIFIPIYIASGQIFLIKI